MYGDDFTVLKSLPSLKWVAAGFKQQWTITERGILGPPESEGTTQEIRHLHRLIVGLLCVSVSHHLLEC